MKQGQYRAADPLTLGDQIQSRIPRRQALVADVLSAKLAEQHYQVCLGRATFAYCCRPFNSD